MKAPFFRVVALLIFSFLYWGPAATAQSLPKCTVSGLAPGEEGDMVLSIHGDKDFYVGNAQFVLHIGKAVFTRNTQDGSNLEFYIPKPEFNKLAEGEQMYLRYGDAHSDEDEELLADACRQKLVNTCSLGLFTRDLLDR